MKKTSGVAHRPNDYIDQMSKAHLLCAYGSHTISYGLYEKHFAKYSLEPTQIAWYTATGSIQNLNDFWGENLASFSHRVKELAYR